MLFKLTLILVQKELGMESGESGEKEKGPKKKRSAYNFFVSDMKKSGKSTKNIADEWNNLGKNEKSRYDKLANQDKIRFNNEMLASGNANNLQSPAR